MSFELTLGPPRGIVGGILSSTPWTLDGACFGMPDGPGVYRFTALEWSEDRWPLERIETILWQYVGEGGDMIGRLRRYVDAARQIAAGSQAAPSTHVGGKATELDELASWALRLERHWDRADIEDPLAVGRVEQADIFLQWVIDAQVDTPYGRTPLDLKDELQRRLVERVLIAQSPLASNKA